MSLISPFFQSISGLCIFNQLKPRNMAWVEREVTARGSHSECLLKINSTIVNLEIDPPLFMVLLVL